MLGLLHRDNLRSTGLPAQAPLLQVQQVSSAASSAQVSRKLALAMQQSRNPQVQCADLVLPQFVEVRCLGNLQPQH